MAEKMKKDFKVEQMEAHTLTWWRNRQTKIDMEPPYQRRGRLCTPGDPGSAEQNTGGQERAEMGHIRRS